MAEESPGSSEEPPVKEIASVNGIEPEEKPTPEPIPAQATTSGDHIPPSPSTDSSSSGTKAQQTPPDPEGPPVHPDGLRESSKEEPSEPHIEEPKPSDNHASFPPPPQTDKSCEEEATEPKASPPEADGPEESSQEEELVHASPDTDTSESPTEDVSSAAHGSSDSCAGSGPHPDAAEESCPPAGQHKDNDDEATKLTSAESGGDPEVVAEHSSA